MGWSIPEDWDYDPPFWWGKRVSDKEDMMRAVRDFRNQRGLPQGQFLDLYDTPLGALHPHRQTEADKIIQSYLGAEGSTADSARVKDQIDPDLSLGEALDLAMDMGAKPPQDRREEEWEELEQYIENKAVSRAQEQIDNAIDDLADEYAAAEDVERTDLIQHIQARLDGDTVDTPVDLDDIVLLLEDIQEAFDPFEDAIDGEILVRRALDEWRSLLRSEEEMEEAVEEGEQLITPTDPQGNPIRQPEERIEAFVEEARESGIKAAHGTISDFEMEDLAERMQAGEVDQEHRDMLTDAIENASESSLQDIVDAQTPFFAVMQELPVRIPPPSRPTPEEILGGEPEEELEVEEFSDQEIENAIERVETLLERTSGRNLPYYEAAKTALETGDAVPEFGASQDTLDALPPGEQRRLAERAQNILDQLRQEQLSTDDFPEIQAWVSRGEGRGVEYFRRVIRVLRGEEGPKLDDPIESIERLQDFGNDEVIQEFVRRARNNIEALGGDPTGTGLGQRDRGRGGGVSAADVEDAVRNVLGDIFSAAGEPEGRPDPSDPAWQDELEARFPNPQKRMFYVSNENRRQRLEGQQQGELTPTEYLNEYNPNLGLLSDREFIEARDRTQLE